VNEFEDMKAKLHTPSVRAAAQCDAATTPPVEVSININYTEKLVGFVTLLILQIKIKLKLMLSLYLIN
jgi:hypothetical protein